jgi:hypothetical protein
MLNAKKNRVNGNKKIVWDPLPKVTITSPYVHSRVDPNTFTMGTLYQSRPEPYARVDFIPLSGTLYLTSVHCTVYSAVYIVYPGGNLPTPQTSTCF